MKKKFIAFLCLIYLFIFPLIVTAETPVIVKVGTYENFPKIFTGDDGTAAGFWADVTRYICAKENWQIEWISGTWTQGLKRLKNGEIDIMPDTGWTEPRSRQYAFSEETVLVSWSRLYVPQNSDIKSIVDLDDKIIAALKGSFNLEGPEGIKEIIQKFNLNVTFQKMDSYGQIFKALEQGKIDAGVTNKDFGNQHEGDYAVERTSIIFQPARMQFAFTKDADLTPFLIEKFDGHMRKLKANKNSMYYQSLEKYIGGKDEQTFIEIIPLWVKIVLTVCGGVILFLTAVGITSRVQVRRRTFELRESEKNLSITLDSIGDAVISTNIKGRVVRMNPVAEHLTGWTLEEARGIALKEVFNIVNAQTREPMINPVGQVLETGKIIGLANHTLLLSKNNNRYQIADSAAPIKDDTGNILGVVLVFRDVTKEYQMQEAVFESEQLLRSIFRAAPTGIGVVINRILKQVNERICDMTGYPKEELIGRNSRIFYSCDGEYEFVGREKYRQINAHGTGTVETRWQHKDGHIINVLLSSTPMDINDRSKGVTFTALDITERKHSEAELKKIEIQLMQAQKMESIGTLAGGIAHDFNNILSGILGYSQLAEININNSVKEKGYISQIIKNTQRAAELVQQILTFSRQSEYQKQPVHIYIGVNEALKLLRSTIPATIEIKTKIDSKAMALADPTKIHQLIMNLCTNAYHAMRKTGGQMTVLLTDMEISIPKRLKDKKIPKGNYLRLEVSDTGHGMDERVLKKAFEPYFTTEQMGKGTGLGLALVQAIVDEHDGFLEVYSEPNKGTNFYIYLPIVRKNIEHQTSSRKEISSLKGNENIMFVDDEESIRKITKEFLEKYGYKVSLFENGIEAYKIFEKDPYQFDLTITDMTMPGMGGHKLAANLLKIRSDLPILLCTGFSENISKEKAASIGIKGLIFKPISMRDLAQKIRTILDKK